MVYVRDEDYYQMLPQELGGSEPDDARVKVMAFPPLGIETWLRQSVSMVTGCGCSIPVIPR